MKNIERYKTVSFITSIFELIAYFKFVCKVDKLVFLELNGSYQLRVIRIVLSLMFGVLNKAPTPGPVCSLRSSLRVRCSIIRCFKLTKHIVKL